MDSSSDIYTGSPGDIIISWIGVNDLKVMNAWRKANGMSLCRGFLKKEDDPACLGSGKEEKGRNGPTRTFTDEWEAQTIYLLASAKMHEDGKSFAAWVGRGTEASVQCIPTGVDNPTDYEQLLSALEKFIQDEKLLQKDPERINFLLSPGTPQMQTMSLWYSEQKFPGSRKYMTVSPEESIQGRQIREVRLPFSMASDTARLTSEPALENPDIMEIAETYGDYRKISILLLGETGTGKSTAARKIHDLTSRGTGKFVTAHCAEFAQGGDPSMFRQTLFGTKKGAFTGSEERTGLFAEANDGGTLFLDEIGDLPLTCQSLLLRALQEEEYSRLGEETKIHKITNVRIICATNKDLIHEVQEGRFREDLYYRIAMCPVKLKTLREIRDQDCRQFESIVRDILNQIEQQEDRFKNLRITLDPGAWDLINSYDWPGNHRQLHHTLYISAAYANKRNRGVITAQILKRHISFGDQLLNTRKTGEAGEDGKLPDDLMKWLEDKKVAFVTQALKENGYTISKAAKRLGCSYQIIQRLVRQKHLLDGS